MLGLPKKDKGTSIWHASQMVEPKRDGEHWCTWEDAETMLEAAAKPLLRGPKALKATGYRLDRDKDEMTLTLHLIK